MASEAGPSAHDDRSHDTLLTHTSTQRPLEQTVDSAITTDAMNTMSQTTPSSPPLSTSPCSPQVLVKSAPSDLLVSDTIPKTQQPHPEMHHDDVYQPLATTSSENFAASASSSPTELSPNRTSKRTRMDSESDNVPPVVKKIARSSKVKSDTSTTMMPIKKKEPVTLSTDGNAAGDEKSDLKEVNQTIAGPSGTDLNDSQNQPAEPAEPGEDPEKSRAKPKRAVKKPIATAARRRACDTCKRRKVKCKHNPTAEETDATADTKTESSPDKPVKKATKARNITHVDDQEQPTQVVGSENGKLAVEKVLPKKTQAKGKSISKKAAAPPERTSLRNRKAPERLVDVQEQPLTKASPARKNTSKVFDPVYITTNSTSRLGKADMHKALCEETAWTSLSAEQQTTLISMLPCTTERQQLLVKIKAGETGNETRPQVFTVNDDCFRTDVAKFQEDLKNGHLAKTWQAAAEQAVIERAAGDYDLWKAEEAELWWGQKSK